MVKLTPVEHDPFSGQAATTAAPKLTPVDYDPFQAAPPQSDNGLGRQIGRTGRIVAGGGASLLDAARIVSDPVYAIGGKVAKGLGFDDAANEMFAAVNAPTFSQKAKQKYDEATDSKYAPRNTTEAVVDAVGEIPVSIMAGKGFVDLGRKGTEYVDDIWQFARSKFAKNQVPSEYNKLATTLLDDGKTPDQILSAANQLKKNPVPTTLAEQTGSEQAIAMQRSLAEQPTKGGTVLKDFNKQRLETSIPKAIQESAAKEADTTSPLQAGQQIQDAAKKYIEGKIKIRAEKARPIYEMAFSEGQSISSPKVDKILETPAGRKALSNAVTKMQNDRALVGIPDAELAEQAKLVGVYEKGGVAKGLKLRTLDYVKRALDDEIGAAQRAGSKDQAGILIRLKNDLVSELDASVPSYAKARAVYSDSSPEIQKIQNSVIGRIANAKTPEDAAKYVFDQPPETIKQIKTTFLKEDPQAWRDLMGSKLSYEGKKSANIGEYLRRVDRDAVIRENMQSALTPSQYKGHRMLVANLRAVQSGLPSGSPTVPKAQAAARLAEQGIDDVGIMEIQRGGGVTDRVLRWLGNAYSNTKGKLTEERNYKLAQALISPELDKLAAALQGKKVGSPEALQIVDDYMERIAAIGSYADEPRGGNRAVQPQKALPAPAKAIELFDPYKDFRERYKNVPKTNGNPAGANPPAIEPAAVGRQSSIAPDIIQAEGVRDSVYKDSVGKRTIGIGFNMDDPAARDKWKAAGIQTRFEDALSGKAKLSKPEIKQLANASYNVALKDAKQIVPNFDKLSDNRKAAVVHLSYQLGSNNLKKFKNTLSAVRAGNYTAAARQIMNSRLAKQTPERAIKIARMLANDISYDDA